MSKTSTEVKRRYNAKTYSQFNASVRKEDFEHIEALRGGMSRAAFLKALVAFWQAAGAPPLAEAPEEDPEE